MFKTLCLPFNDSFLTHKLSKISNY